MSELSFTVVARDQASQTVAAVQKKVSEFGKEVGRSIAGVLGPMAALQWGIGKVSEYFDELARKRKEAFDWGASLTDSAAKLGVTVQQFQNISDAADATGQSVDNVAKSFKLAADLIDQAKAGSLDAAASLEAMGFSIDNIDKVKPQDVLRSLAGALQATQDPAERAQIAIAALGKSAKDLQDTLAKGFDIAGALENRDGLSDEEANFMRGQRRAERELENRKKLESARKQAAQAFLENDPEGRAIVERERAKARAIVGASGSSQYMVPGSVSTGGNISAGGLASDAAIQAEIQRRLAERERKRIEEENKRRNDAAAKGLLDKANKDAQDEAKKNDDAKKSKEKGEKQPPSTKPPDTSPLKLPPVTVSSLREIGGGLAGETATSADVAFQSLAEQRAINDTLRRIEAKLVPPPTQTDFTKNPLLGGGGPQYVPGQNNMGPTHTGSRVGVA